MEIYTTSTTRIFKLDLQRFLTRHLFTLYKGTNTIRRCSITYDVHLALVSMYWCRYPDAGWDRDRRHWGQLYWLQSQPCAHLQRQLGAQRWRQDRGGARTPGVEGLRIRHPEGRGKRHLTHYQERYVWCFFNELPECRQTILCNIQYKNSARHSFN